MFAKVFILLVLCASAALAAAIQTETSAEPLAVLLKTDAEAESLEPANSFGLGFYKSYYGHHYGPHGYYDYGYPYLGYGHGHFPHGGYFYG